jgi:hypothetical protein
MAMEIRKIWFILKLTNPLIYGNKKILVVPACGFEPFCHFAAP